MLSRGSRQNWRPLKLHEKPAVNFKVNTVTICSNTTITDTSMMHTHTHTQSYHITGHHKNLFKKTFEPLTLVQDFPLQKKQP